MPEPERKPIFHLSIPAVAPVALVSLTVSVSAGATVVFTNVHCPACRRMIMAMPGIRRIETRMVRCNAERSGRGPVVGCPRCRGLVEVIDHG